MASPIGLRPQNWSGNGRGQEPRPTGGNPGAAALLGLAIGALIVVAAGVLYIQPWSRPAETMVSEAKPEQPTPTPPLRPTYSREIAEISGLIQQGKYATAADLAEVHLRNQADPPSPEASTILAGLSYNATMAGLYAPADDLGQAAFSRWRDADIRAEVYRVSPRIAPLTVSQSAAGASLWLLARGAFLKAWEQGAVRPTDLGSVSSYYALLRNLGGALHRQSPAESKEQGLVFLRTADAISDGFRLGRGEARDDLIQVLGPDQTRWPQPLGDDPVLAARLKR